MWRLVGTELAVDYDAVAEVRREARWHLTLWAGGGQRELEAETCRALGEAAALILALAIDPELEGPSEEATPSTAVTLAGDSEVSSFLDAPRPATAPAGGEAPLERGSVELGATAPSQAGPDAAIDEVTGTRATDAGRNRQATLDEPRASSAPTPRGRLANFAGALVEFGSLPQIAPGVELGFDLPVARRGRLGLGVQGLLPRRATVYEARATLWLFGLRATLGYAFQFGALRLVPFAAAELGLMGGRGRGISRPLLGWTAWLAAGSGVEVAVRLSARVALAIQGDLRLPLWRPAFVIEGIGQAYQAPPLVGRLALRVHLRF